MTYIKRFIEVKRKETQNMKGNFLTAKAKKTIRVFKLFIISLIFVGIAASVAVVGCNYAKNRNFKETFYCVSSLKVNNKIRVIQISDLHNASYGKNNQKLIDRIEKLNPDLIIYTGDCVDSNSKSDDMIISLCTALVKIAPSYYIYGNNEVEKYYDTALTQEALDNKFAFNNDNRDPKKLLEIADSFAEKITNTGVKVLKNSSDTITVGTTKVDVYGVLTSNPSSFWSYAGESFDEYIYSNENNLKITAIHEPLVFEEYSPDFWGDLSLAGHTHGGTAKIPMLGPVYTHDGGLLPARGGHLVYGRYDVQGRPLIISSGLDNNNLFRINNSPELVIVDINKF
jgi:predicted MPP superfamily phosphohydrolase